MKLHLFEPVPDIGALLNLRASVAAWPRPALEACLAENP